MTQTKTCPLCRGSLEITAPAPVMVIPPELDDARLTVRAFRVLAHLCRRAGEGMQDAHNVAEIMMTTRLNRKAAQAALSELVVAGFIVRECQPRTSALYRLAGKEAGL